MTEPRFARRFLLDLLELEATAGAAERKQLEQTLSAIAVNPSLPGRIPSYYDPSSPSYLFRSGRALVHYRVGDDGTVEFLNLFFSRI